MNREEIENCAGRRILIAGIGNIFLGDDGFGVEVVQRLISRAYPPGVEVRDSGLRGRGMAYMLLDEYDTLILVDAAPRGGTPGTLYLIEPDLSECTPQKGSEAARMALDAHSMDPMKVLAFAFTLGARPRQVLLVGCEPQTCEDFLQELSPPVSAAVDAACDRIRELVADGTAKAVV